MSRVMSVLAWVAVLGLAGVAGAAETKAAKDAKGAKAGKGWAGVVEKVDGSFLVVKKTRKSGKAGESVRVPTTDKTIVKIDGKAGKLASLEAGHRVRVMPATGPARRIEAVSASGAAKTEKKASKEKKENKAKKAAKGDAKAKEAAKGQ